MFEFQALKASVGSTAKTRGQAVNLHRPAEVWGVVDVVVSRVAPGGLRAILLPAAAAATSAAATSAAATASADPATSSTASSATSDASATSSSSASSSSSPATSSPARPATAAAIVECRGQGGSAISPREGALRGQ